VLVNHTVVTTVPTVKIAKYVTVQNVCRKINKTFY